MTVASDTASDCVRATGFSSAMPGPLSSVPVLEVQRLGKSISAANVHMGMRHASYITLTSHMWVQSQQEIEEKQVSRRSIVIRW
jgi:hypothetical protein